MATSVATRQRRLILSYRQAWFGLSHAGGPGREWQHSTISTAKKRAYAAAAVAIRQRSIGWRTRKVFIGPKHGQKDIRDDIVCEFCLVGMPVVLVQPGIISGHEHGDWTCATCDPDVAGPILTMWALGRLVGVESA